MNLYKNVVTSGLCVEDSVGDPLLYKVDVDKLEWVPFVFILDNLAGENLEGI